MFRRANITTDITLRQSRDCFNCSLLNTQPTERRLTEVVGFNDNSIICHAPIIFPTTHFQ
jgi:hypothetical protein